LILLALLLIFIASQLFWIWRLVDVEQRFIPGRPRRVWLAIMTVVVYLFVLLYSYPEWGQGHVIRPADYRPAERAYPRGILVVVRGIYGGVSLQSPHPPRGFPSEAFLVGRGYRIAPVTMDAWDWMYAGVYEEARKRGDTALQQQLVSSYLSTLARCSTITKNSQGPLRLRTQADPFATWQLAGSRSHCRSARLAA
jgi:hypothetical protein